MEIEKRVCEFLAEHLGHDLEKVTLDANLVDDLGADSLDAVEVAMEIEEMFSVPEVQDDDVIAWKTVADVVTTVKNLTVQPANPTPDQQAAADALGEAVDNALKRAEKEKSS